jgi:nucleotide-binding universal stress UspA family protein
MTITTIVVATDGSENASRAVAHAADVAAGTGAKVIAVHVFEPLALLGRVEPPVDFLAREAEAAELLQSTWCAPLSAAGTSFEARVVEGKPSVALLEVARDVDADLIIMGARGLSRVKGLLLGSTSTKVLHHAHRPVTVVPPA